MQMRKPVDSRVFVAGLIAVGVALPAGIARAQDATAVEIFKTQFFGQSEAGPPSGPNAWGFNARIVGSDLVIGMSSGSVASPLGVLPLDFFGDAFIFFGGSGLSQADLDAQYPAGSYEFSVAGGSFGAQAASVRVPVDNLYPDTVPYVLNYGQLANEFDPEQDFVIQFPSFGSAPENETLATFITIRQPGGDPDVLLTAVVDSFATEVTVPAFTLFPETSYVLTLAFSARDYVASTAIDGEVALGMCFDFSTDIPFTTSLAGGPVCPCPADYDNSGSPIPDIDDLIAFFADFAEGDGTTLDGDPSADVDCTAEGSIPDIDDILRFFEVFAAGC